MYFHLIRTNLDHMHIYLCAFHNITSLKYLHGPGSDSFRYKEITFLFLRKQSFHMGNVTLRART